MNKYFKDICNPKARVLPCGVEFGVKVISLCLGTSFVFFAACHLPVAA